MAEDLHKNNPWSQRLKDWEASGTGPEPLPGDWSRLAEKMDKGSRRRGAAWWWWGSGLLIIAGLVLVFLFPQPNSQGGVTTIAEELTTSNKLPMEQEAVADKAVETEAVTISPTTTTAENEPEVTTSFESELNPTLAATSSTPILLELPASTPAKEIGSDPAELRLQLNAPSITLENAGGTSNSEEREQNERTLPSSDSQEGQIAYPTISSLYPLYLSTRLPKLRPVLGQWGRTMADQGHENLAEENLTANGENEEPQPTAWSLAVGPQLGVFRPEVNIELPANTLAAETEAKSIAYTFGIGAQIRIGKHWGFQTGISRSREDSRHRFFLARAYNPANEILDAQGNGVNRIELDYTTSYTKGEAEVELFRSADVPTTEIRFIRLAVILKEEVETTTIPLLLTYDLPLSNKFGLRLGAGASWNRQTVTVDIQSRLSALIDMEVRRSGIRSSERLLNSEFWTGQLVAGLVYQPFSHWEINLFPQWFTSLSNLSADRQLNADYSRFSFSAGINYRF
ncbi:MAG: hypothetical protein AAF433_19515 [Bacteroidota bacterium]